MLLVRPWQGLHVLRPAVESGDLRELAHSRASVALILTFRVVQPLPAVLLAASDSADPLRNLSRGELLY